MTGEPLPCPRGLRVDCWCGWREVSFSVEILRQLRDAHMNDHLEDT